MKVKVVVRQLITSVREVEVKDYAELKRVIEDDGRYAGRCLKQESTASIVYEPYDENSRALPEIIEYYGDLIEG